MKISAFDGMVNIDGDNIAYSNIREMYNSGNGCGIQLSKEIEGKREIILTICDEIADRIYKLQDILDAKN